MPCHSLLFPGSCCWQCSTLVPWRTWMLPCHHCPDLLSDWPHEHAYWDNMPGSDSSVNVLAHAGLTLVRSSHERNCNTGTASCHHHYRVRVGFTCLFVLSFLMISLGWQGKQLVTSSMLDWININSPFKFGHRNQFLMSHISHISHLICLLWVYILFM